MSYEAMKQAYNTLTAEQQLIVYNLTISLMHLNAKLAKHPENAHSDNLRVALKPYLPTIGK